MADIVDIPKKNEKIIEFKMVDHRKIHESTASILTLLNGIVSSDKADWEEVANACLSATVKACQMSGMTPEETLDMLNSVQIEEED